MNAQELKDAIIFKWTQLLVIAVFGKPLQKELKGLKQKVFCLVQLFVHKITRSFFNKHTFIVHFVSLYIDFTPTQ